MATKDRDLSKEASALAKRGASKGGRARADSLNPERRTEIARQASLARWGNVMPAAEHVGTLTIGEANIDCAVLNDEEATRVLSQRGVLAALSRTGGARRQEGVRRAPFLSAANLQPFISDELHELAANPIHYRDINGIKAFGYKADMLRLLCETYLAARQADVLTYNQEPVAQAAEVLMRGFAAVGIVALIDEATGFQDVRAKDALAEILEAFIAKELQPWVRTFPEDFYEQLFRLRRLDYPHGTVKRPQYFGILTNDLIYRRIAPGVLDELKRVAERTESGRLSHKYFQRLTQNTGYPKLREHLGSTVAIMKLSDDWSDFVGKMDRIHPRFGETMQLQFDRNDSGVGL